MNENTVDLIKFEGYRKFDLFRSDRRGGGVSIFVDVNFESTCLLSLCLDYIEVLCVESKRVNEKVLIFSIYRPPNSSVELFIDKAAQIFNGFDFGSYTNVVCCGDFNLNMLDLNVNDSVRNFVDFMYSCSLLPIITKPTRITDRTQSLIDQFFVYNPVNYFACSLCTNISDHLPIVLICKRIFNFNSAGGSIQVKYRLISEMNLSNMYYAASTHDFGGIENQASVEGAVSELYNVLFDYYNISCPIRIKTVSYKDKVKPWIGDELKKLIKRRERYYILYRKGKLNGNVFKSFANEVTKKN